MTSFAEIVHAVFNSPTTARPGRLLRSLPHIVRRIFPHVRYSPSLETLVAGSHPSSASAHKMPPSPIQDEVPFKTSTTHGKVYSLHTGIWPQLHTLCSHPDDLVFRILYKPHGKFAWMDGQTIKDVKVLKWLGEGVMSSAHIKSGNVGTPHGDGGGSVTFHFICKTWDISKMGQWNGFYSELALYKSSRYLLPLQGDVVPHVMGVYTHPGKIDIAMDLPHPVFWMEASASMPIVLKDRVIEAFQKLHEKGVVHGDVALRHILIGADARVTLIDFQASRADEPNEDLGLVATSPGEKDLEMRRIKFLLNVGNARKKEFRKSKAARKRSARNKAREQRRRELLQHGIINSLPLDESEPLEDIREPPVPLEELEKYWMVDVNDDPRRFVVPGSSDSDVARAVASFLQCIRDMEGADCGWSDICNGPSSPRSPLASPSLSPRLDGVSIPGLPSSIKVRDFAYESTCWTSISRLQAEHHMDMEDHGPSLSPSAEKEKGSTSGDMTIAPSHSSNHLKRHHEEGEEKATYVERLPTGKRARLDSSLWKECNTTATAEAKIASDCGLVMVHPEGLEAIPRPISADGCQGTIPVNEPEAEHPRPKRLREAVEASDIDVDVNAKKRRVSAQTKARYTSESVAVSGFQRSSTIHTS